MEVDSLKTAVDLNAFSFEQVNEYRRDVLRSNFEDWRRFADEMDVYIDTRFPEFKNKIWDKAKKSTQPLEKAVVKMISMHSADWETAKKIYLEKALVFKKQTLGESKYNLY